MNQINQVYLSGHRGIKKCSKHLPFFHCPVLYPPRSFPSVNPSVFLSFYLSLSMYVCMYVCMYVSTYRCSLMLSPHYQSGYISPHFCSTYLSPLLSCSSLFLSLFFFSFILFALSCFFPTMLIFLSYLFLRPI